MKKTEILQRAQQCFIDYALALNRFENAINSKDCTADDLHTFCVMSNEAYLFMRKLMDKHRVLDFIYPEETDFNLHTLVDGLARKTLHHSKRKMLAIYTTLELARPSIQQGANLILLFAMQALCAGHEQSNKILQHALKLTNLLMDLTEFYEENWKYLIHQESMRASSVAAIDFMRILKDFCRDGENQMLYRDFVLQNFANVSSYYQRALSHNLCTLQTSQLKEHFIQLCYAVGLFELGLNELVQFSLTPVETSNSRNAFAKLACLINCASELEKTLSTLPESSASSFRDDLTPVWKAASLQQEACITACVNMNLGIERLQDAFLSGTPLQITSTQFPILNEIEWSPPGYDSRQEALQQKVNDLQRMLAQRSPSSADAPQQIEETLGMLCQAYFILFFIDEHTLSEKMLATIIDAHNGALEVLDFLYTTLFAKINLLTCANALSRLSSIENTYTRTSDDLLVSMARDYTHVVAQNAPPELKLCLTLQRALKPKMYAEAFIEKLRLTIPPQEAVDIFFTPRICWAIGALGCNRISMTTDATLELMSGTAKQFFEPKPENTREDQLRADFLYALYSWMIFSKTEDRHQLSCALTLFSLVTAHSTPNQPTLPWIETAGIFKRMVKVELGEAKAAHKAPTPS